MKNIYFAFLLLLISHASQSNIKFAQSYYDKGDFVNSFNEYYKIAILGNVRAQYNVAVMLFTGKGTQKDTINAYAWSRTAGSSKSSTKEFTDQISATLLASQIQEAEQLATKYINLYGIIATKTLLGPMFQNTSNESSAPMLNSANFNRIINNRKSKKKLLYPNKAVKKGRRGWVDLTFDIMPDGTVQNIYIFHQFPHELFAPSAIEYSQQQLFDFYMNDEKVKANQSAISSLHVKYGVYGWSGILDRKMKLKIEKLYQSAIKGSLESQYHYANLFYTILNKNGKVNEKTINRWLYRSSQFGIADAQYKLGHNIFFGNSCIIEQQKGLDWIIRSAQGGNNKARYLAYQILKDDDLINNSQKSAQQWLVEGAINDSYISQFIIAKQIAANRTISASDNTLATQYLDNYAEQVGKTIDWYQTKALILSDSKQFTDAEKAIKIAIKMAKKAHWNLTELQQQKTMIQKYRS